MLLTRKVPHLAFIDPDRYDRLIASLDERNAACRRRKLHGRDPRKQVPKKRTRFPGQAIFCGICGRMYVYGGHGREACLMCSGAREHSCWNGATCGEALTRERVCEAVFRELEQLGDVDAELSRRIVEQDRLLTASSDAAVSGKRQELDRIERELAHVLAFIRQGMASPTLAEELQRLEDEKRMLQLELSSLKESQCEPLTLPSADEIRSLALASFQDLGRDSFEFADRLRRLIPRIVVTPYRLIDSDKVVLKARFRLKVSALLPNQRSQEAIAQEIDRIVEVNLYDPPQREVYRERIATLRRSMSIPNAAKACGITKTAAQYAVKLQRMMDERSLTDPYVEVVEPPANSRKLRRHLHPRYAFKPLDNPRGL